jgi:pimeloyl-ACP methyl ester carboxylesterase
VLDATGIERAVLVGFSFGAHLAALLAAHHPGRVVSAMLIAPAAPFGLGTGVQAQRAFLEPSVNDDGWSKYNRDYWRRDYRGFTDFFFREALNEPHSTKQIEDCVAWASETSAETLIDTILGRYLSRTNASELRRKRLFL